MVIEVGGSGPRQEVAEVDATRQWLRDVVIGHNFCPFAKRELERDSIACSVCDSAELSELLQSLVGQCRRLDADPSIETLLLIFPRGVADFDGFLQLLELANELLFEQGYEGVYQLASFHPDYCFEGEATDDAANYTNRAPYPVLHILREASLARALESVAQPELIPERNIAYARQLGIEQLRAQLAACYQSTSTASWRPL